MPQTFTLCSIDDVQKTGSKGVEIPNSELTYFVVEHDGGHHFYVNRCPHLNVELEMLEDRFLDMDGYFIQCATHGALFERDTGNCVSGPCQGDKLIKLECWIEGNDILTDLDKVPLS